MKVAIQCVSPLLQRSLELFLHDRLSSYKQCDLVIRDRPRAGEEHPQFLIGPREGAHLEKPFSKSQLLLSLEKFMQDRQVGRDAMETARMMEEPEVVQKSSPEGFALLEKRITQLTREYQENVMKAVRAFYEN